MRLDLAEQDPFLTVVDALHGVQQLRTVPGRFGARGQGPDILGETRPAVTATRVDEVVADPRIRSDADADVLDIGAEALGDIGQFVHEADSGGQHRVGGVFRQFCRAHVHDHHPIVVAVERIVERLEQFRRSGIAGADENPVRLHEVVDRRPLLEKLRVGDHVELCGDVAFVQYRLNLRLHPVSGAHGHGRLDHHDAVLAQMRADGPCSRQNMLQVRRAVFVRGRTHRDELKQPVVDALADVRGEAQPAPLACAIDEGLEPGFVDRQLAPFQAGNPVCVNIHAHHVIAGLRQARAGHQAHVSGAEDSQAHGCSHSRCPDSGEHGTRSPRNPEPRTKARGACHRAVIDRQAAGCLHCSRSGRLAQRESAPLTRERSLVQSQHRPPHPGLLS